MFRVIILPALFFLFCISLFCGCEKQKEEESAYGPYPGGAMDEQYGPYPKKGK